MTSDSSSKNIHAQQSDISMAGLKGKKKKYLNSINVCFDRKFSGKLSKFIQNDC